ncbi:DUF4199 family protein [Flavobacterium sp. TP390]|uniref:DUF4199 family protein n=1 Tax=Flavobacterium profundi TaxID=1774945 RepID=A0A6I4IHU2_9FLAO|nr:DUF4199 domain-containing protein [Flavobacterium profundi]MVO09134.1 DUF4199 family protein [Flavobacterium profundi]
MDKSTSPAKSGLNYGIIFAVIMILEFVIMYALNINPQEKPMVGIIMNVLNYLILPFAFIYLAATNFKNNFNNGFISLGQTLKIGVSLCAFAALIYGLFYIIFDLIIPEFSVEMFEKIQEVTVRQNPNMTSEQLKMSMKFVKMFMNPYVLVPFTIIMYSVIGIVHSLIVGLIVRKDKPSF